ncbi:MAG: hypothetical protein N3A61_07075 [Ignavibacteria bacterium]|nr:hypothetical protein [Ignavibacteria bacterium]
MFKKLNSLILSILLLFSLNVIAQEHQECADDEKDLESKVAELDAFHEVIYPIWHTAYPEKDYNALRSYLPEVNKLAEAIYNAKLPGILRDKEDKWKEGLKVFKNSVDDYNKACAGTGNEALLKAAEVMHAKYEMLVRIIRPVLKEVDAFHKVLYVIYHKYLPEKKYKEIAKVGNDLKVKAEAITKAKLSKRLEARTEAFNKASAELLQSVNKLIKVSKSNKGKAIENAVEEMHTKYQNVEKIFD